MRVSQSTSNQVQSSETTGAKKTERTQRDQGGAEAKKAANIDSGAVNAEISGKAREFSKAKAVASSAPDVREEKVAELKRKISEGKYQVNAEALADRMVDEHMASGIG